MYRLNNFLLLVAAVVKFTCATGNNNNWNPKNILEKIPCITPKHILPYDWITAKEEEGNTDSITYFPLEAKSSSYSFSKELKKGGIQSDQDFNKYCLYGKEQINSIVRQSNGDVETYINVTYSAFGKTIPNFSLKQIKKKEKIKSVEHWKGNRKEETLYTIWKSSSKSNPLQLIISCITKPGIMTWFTLSRRPNISKKDKTKILQLIKSFGFNPDLAGEIYVNCKI